MYYPYFRGKQNELIVIREYADVMSQNNIIPIIEPVKQSLSGLKRTIWALIEADTHFILVINPKHGDFVTDNTQLRTQICDVLVKDGVNFSVGYILDQDTDLIDLERIGLDRNNLSIIHNGYPRAQELANVLSSSQILRHIFIEESCSRLYRRHFNSVDNVLIRDGFVSRNNRDYPIREHFSDLHITYPDERSTGFGDFLIVGNDYTETGGPAYAVAIHLTMIDSNEDDDMFMLHYISDRTHSPVDPGGKFLEALNKLVRGVDENPSIFKSNAIREYRELHQRQHFPGLGYVKKLSMQHHIELIANFLNRGLML